MRIPWFWKQIWHGSISGNICLRELSNPAKFDAFIKKQTILSLNSRTIRKHKEASNSHLSHGSHELLGH